MDLAAQRHRSSMVWRTFSGWGAIAFVSASIACRSDHVDAAGAGSSEGPASSTGGPPATTGLEDEGETASSRGSTGTGPDGDPVKLDLAALPDVAGMPPLEPIPTSCTAAAMGSSSVGCEFFAVDLDQLEDDLPGGTAQYAIGVSNVQLDQVATVTVERRVDGVWETVISAVEIEPLAQQTFPLPDLHQEQTGVLRGGSYRVSTDVPVAAYQYNPLNIGFAAASSDASLLLPTSAWDDVHHVVGWEGAPNSAYVTVVAAFDGTVVEIVPSRATLAGGEVPGGAAGIPFSIDLDAGDVVEVAATGPGSLTGTRVRSDAAHPIGVYSGAECTLVLDYSCDHLEEQLTGLRHWGRRFVAARMPPRLPLDPETSVWQIYASEDATQVSFTASPAVTGLPPEDQVLDAGEVLTLEVGGSAFEPGDFVVEADAPIAVVNYMTGSIFAQMQGDPAMVQIPPVEQFLPRYVVLVPTTWDVDVLTIIRTAGAEVMLDGVAVDDDAFVAVGDWEVARIEAIDGVHVLDGATGFGVLVTGYTSVDSYAYAGGTGTALINPNPEG